MTTFHRLTTPTYFMSGGWPPSGYDYINDGLVTDAPADGAKASGDNQNSYFVAFGEDATSAYANRPHKALAQNCDQLDDWLNSSAPMQVTVAASTPAGPAVQDIALTGEVYVGESGASDSADMRNQLLMIIDPATGQRLTDANGYPIRMSLLHNGSGSDVIGSEADGFYTDPTARFSPLVPASTAYKLVYFQRSSLSNFVVNLPDAMVGNWLRGADLNIFDNAGSKAWYGGAALQPRTVDKAFQQIVGDLSQSTAKDNCGFDRIGAGALPATHIPLVVGSGMDMMEELADAAAGLDVANTFTEANTFEGAGFGLILDTDIVCLEPTTSIKLPVGGTLGVVDDGSITLFTVFEDLSGVEVAQGNLFVSGGSSFIEFGHPSPAGPSSDVGILVQKQTGTGTEDGRKFTIGAQPGRDTSVADNNDGGEIELVYGEPSTNGGGAEGEPGQLTEVMHGTDRLINRWTLARDSFDVAITEGEELYRYTLPTNSVLTVKVLEMSQTEGGSSRFDVRYYFFKRLTGATVMVGTGDVIAGEADGGGFYTLVTVSSPDVVFTSAGGLESINEDFCFILELNLYSHGTITPYV
jgi:hypothetical protein